MKDKFEPTHEDFKALKKDLKLKNADIGLIIGLSADSVKNQTQPSKELPTWARAMIFIWKKENSEILE